MRGLECRPMIYDSILATIGRTPIVRVRQNSTPTIRTTRIAVWPVLKTHWSAIVSNPEANRFTLFTNAPAKLSVKNRCE